LRDDKARFDKGNAVIFGVNNNTPDAHRKYCDKFKFTFPLLVDSDLAVSKAYGAEKGGSVRRTVVVIGPDSTVRYHKHGMPTDDEILEALG